MKVEVKVPSVGESVKEAILVEWYKQDGESVEKDDLLFLIETDKVTLEVAAEASGTLSTKAEVGDTVAIGDVVGYIDSEAEAKEPAEKEEKAKTPEKAEKKAPESGPEPKSEPAAAKETPSEERAPSKQAPPTTESKPAKKGEEPLMSPSVRRLATQKEVDVTQLEGSGPGGRVTKGDVLEYIEKQEAASAQPQTPQQGVEGMAEASEEIERKPMSPIRQKIAEHLLTAKNSTAMLTTFNEIDMSNVMAVRSQFKEQFKERHQVSLGFMSFFVKASVQALKEIPQINAFIDGKDIIYHNYYHVGVAVGSPRGLVVPVIRHADRLSYAAIEQTIIDYVTKIKENKLQLSDMEGGTFTITNGGVFGSLLSTPILNSPQSAILGMHKIEKRPVVVNDEIVIRPMMYVALSYDHRIVDGKEAVTCLRRIKECIENPERMLMEV